MYLHHLAIIAFDPIFADINKMADNTTQDPFYELSNC